MNASWKMKVELLHQWICDATNIVVFTGAGISTASGIPDFRSPSGLYKKKGTIDPEEILSHHYFMAHPESFYHFLKKEMLYPNAKPNIAHQWVKELENNHKVTVITQNIDDLHQKAGSKNVLELHGNIHSFICMNCGKHYGKECLQKELPICPCNGLIRPDVVLYGESLKESVLNESIFALLRADMVIVMGSSLIVNPAASLLSYYQGDHLVILNREKTVYDQMANLVIGEDMIKVIKELLSY